MGLQPLHLEVMAGNGRGSINSKLKRCRSAGQLDGHAQFLLDNTISDVRKLASNVRRTPLTNIEKKLNEVVETTEVVSRSWRNCTKTPTFHPSSAR